MEHRAITSNEACVLTSCHFRHDTDDHYSPRTPISPKKQQNKAQNCKNKALFSENKALFRIKIFVNFIFNLQNLFLNQLNCIKCILLMLQF